MSQKFATRTPFQSDRVAVFRPDRGHFTFPLRRSPSNLETAVTFFIEKEKHRSEISTDSRNPLDPVTYKKDKENDATSYSLLLHRQKYIACVFDNDTDCFKCFGAIFNTCLILHICNNMCRRKIK